MKQIEEEVVILNAVIDLVDTMVNRAIFSVVGESPKSNILFHDYLHQRFFNIALVDFLSKTDKKGPIKSTSYIGGLRKITKNPSFNIQNSVDELNVVVGEFGAWLDQVVEVDAWLPHLDQNPTLTLSRSLFLKMCGNLSKHNYLRSVGVAKELQHLLKESGFIVELTDAILALEDFYERFHSDILNYHSSTIAEYLNNIRWGIHEYLLPEFQSSYVKDVGELPKYHYTYPNEIESKFAKTCYWELMNKIRSKPYVQKFEVTKWLKKRY